MEAHWGLGGAKALAALRMRPDDVALDESFFQAPPPRLRVQC